MSTLVITAMLQALLAKAITSPEPLDAAAMQAVPSMAARAITVQDLPRLPAEPVTVAIQCLVRPNNTLGDCIPADDGGTADIKVFRQRLFAGIGGTPVDPVVGAALARAQFYRVRASSPAKRDADRSVLVRVTISSADKAPNTANGAVAKGDVKIDPASITDIAEFYPPPALRADARTRITATCRVLADRSLYCRDPHVDLLPGQGAAANMAMPQFDAAFGRATLLAFATMRAQSRTGSGKDSVGREGPMSLSWQLP